MTCLAEMTELKKKTTASDQDRRSEWKSDEWDTSSQPKKYSALNTTINNIVYSIKGKPFLKRPKPLIDHLVKQKPNKYQTTENTTWNS